MACTPILLLALTGAAKNRRPGKGSTLGQLSVIQAESARLPHQRQLFRCLSRHFMQSHAAHTLAL